MFVCVCKLVSFFPAIRRRIFSFSMCLSVFNIIYSYTDHVLISKIVSQNLTCPFSRFFFVYLSFMFQQRISHVFFCNNFLLLLLLFFNELKFKSFVNFLFRFIHITTSSFIISLFKSEKKKKLLQNFHQFLS